MGESIDIVHCNIGKNSTTFSTKWAFHKPILFKLLDFLQSTTIKQFKNKSKNIEYAWQNCLLLFFMIIIEMCDEHL